MKLMWGSQHHPLRCVNGLPQSSTVPQKDLWWGAQLRSDFLPLTGFSLPKAQNHLSRSLQHIPEDLSGRPPATWAHIG